LIVSVLVSGCWLSSDQKENKHNSQTHDNNNDPV